MHKEGQEKNLLFTEERVKDSSMFGAGLMRLTRLSKYLDLVAAATLSGDHPRDDAEQFVTQARVFYTTLREELLGQFTDETETERAKAAMLPLAEGTEVLTASLVVDQALAFLTSTVEAGSFSMHLRQASNEALGEQPGGRVGPSGAGELRPGTYL